MCPNCAISGMKDAVGQVLPIKPQWEYNPWGSNDTVKIPYLFWKGVQLKPNKLLTQHSPTLKLYNYWSDQTIKFETNSSRKTGSKKILLLFRLMHIITSHSCILK